MLERPAPEFVAGESGEGTAEAGCQAMWSRRIRAESDTYPVLVPRTGRVADEVELSVGSHETRPFGRGIFFRS